jgi:TRAP-type C4-dicarboxylate transport system permease small subunit
MEKGSQIVAQTAFGGMLSAMMSWLRDDARAWSVSDRAAFAWLALPLVATVLLAATYLVKPIFRFLTDEDSVIEWIQILAIVASVVGTAWVSLVM